MVAIVAGLCGLIHYNSRIDVRHAETQKEFEAIKDRLLTGKNTMDRIERNQDTMREEIVTHRIEIRTLSERIRDIEDHFPQGCPLAKGGG